MLRFGERNSKGKVLCSKKTYKNLRSKLAKTKTNCKCSIEYLDKAITQLVLIMSKMSRYIRHLKLKKEIEIKSNKLMSFHIDHEKLLEKYEAIWTKIEDLKNIELNALPVYDDRYMKTKIRTYGHKVYTNFCGLNVPEDNIECESFTVISIDSLLVNEKKYYLQIYLDNCPYKIVSKQMKNYLDGNFFKD